MIALASATTTATWSRAPNRWVSAISRATGGVPLSTAPGPLDRCGPAQTTSSTIAGSRSASQTATSFPTTRRTIGPASTCGRGIALLLLVSATASPREVAYRRAIPSTWLNARRSADLVEVLQPTEALVMPHGTSRFALGPFNETMRRCDAADRHVDSRFVVLPAATRAVRSHAPGHRAVDSGPLHVKSLPDAHRRRADADGLHSGSGRLSTVGPSVLELSPRGFLCMGWPAAGFARHPRRRSQHFPRRLRRSGR